MTRPLIVIGDRTDHGGAVVGSSAVTDTNGKRIARVGDKVTCPRKGHGGTTVIVTGDATFIIDGQPAARHGDKCACGATLLSSQAETVVDEAGGSGGAGASSSSSFSEGSASNAVALQSSSSATAPAVAASSTPAQTETIDADEQIRVVDQNTGEPLADVPYFIETEFGHTYSGKTDERGLTRRVHTEFPAQLTVWVGEDAERKQRGEK